MKIVISLVIFVSFAIILSCSNSTAPEDSNSNTNNTKVFKRMRMIFCIAKILFWWINSGGSVVFTTAPCQRECADC